MEMKNQMVLLSWYEVTLFLIRRLNMWSEEVTNSGLAEKFPKAVHHLCSPSDTIQSVLVEYGVRVHFNRETLMYSYLIK